MRLFYSPTSPFVRKVMACAIARRLDGEIEAVACNPHVSPPDLVRDNPLSKVPCLIALDGTPLFDSPVICEYLDGLGEVPSLFPPAGSPARIAALRLQAMADGILDAAVGRRMQAPHPQDEARRAFDARQKAAVDRTLAMLELAGPPAPTLTDIGAIALGCALGYLDFRFAQEDWRRGRPRLEAWFSMVEPMEPLARTRPAEMPPAPAAG